MWRADRYRAKAGRGGIAPIASARPGSRNVDAISGCALPKLVAASAADQQQNFVF
jgi:hypothetical protein